MSKNLLAAAAAATVLATPALAWAEEAASPHSLTANVGVFSQYVFRGLAQTNEDPAIQGGFDYSYAFSGAPVSLYAGTWGSNISWLKENLSVNVPPLFTAGTYGGGGSLELDLYAGLKGNFGKTDFTWDVGYLYYWYPGDLNPALGFTPGGLPNFNIDADTQELYAAVGWKWFTVKYSYSLDDTFGVADSEGTYYLDLSAAVPLGDTGLTVGAHWGKQKFKGNDPRNIGLASNDDLFSYDDWRISLAYDMGKLSKTLSGAELGVAYTDTSSANACGYGAASPVPIGFAGTLFTPCFGAYPKDIADGKITAWFKKTF